MPLRIPGSIAAVALVAAAASACGAGDDAASATRVQVEVVAREGAEPVSATLECDPVGGDHPRADQACDQLLGADASVFEPVPRDRACTMILGGPETATVTGTVAGRDVDASLSKANGCEIARWDALTHVLDLQG